MSEYYLYNNLKKALSQSGFKVELQRHEDSLSVGMPDCSYSLCGVNGWIEFKYSAKEPNYFKTKLRDEQKTWLIRHGIAGGNCYVLHKMGDLTVLYNYSKIFSLEGLDNELASARCDLSHRGTLNACSGKLVEILSKKQDKPFRIDGIGSIS